MAVRKRKRGGSWIAYWREPGSRKLKTKSFGPGPDGEAAARAYDESRDYVYNRKTTKDDGGPRVNELAQYYCNNHQLASNNAADHLIIRLEANLLPFFGNRHAIRLEYQDVDQYYKHRRNTAGVKNSTINREINDLQAIINFSTGRKPPIIPYNPISGYKKPPTDDEIITPPDPDEIAAILAACSPHMTRFVYLCMYLGARPGYREILTRKWDDVRWHRGHIVVISARKGGPPLRHVPLHPVLRYALSAWYAIDRGKFGSGLVGKKGIVNYHGRSIQKIGKAWRGTLDRAGIRRRIRPYDLRHQFASDLIGRGVDIKTVSELMGSAPATITKHYQHVDKAQHRRAIELVSGIQSATQKTR
jgi:integrase